MKVKSAQLNSQFWWAFYLQGLLSSLPVSLTEENAMIVDHGIIAEKAEA